VIVVGGGDAARAFIALDRTPISCQTVVGAKPY
jgi:hypothetical protein